MNVNRIGAAGYLAAGYEIRKTERNVAGGNFAEQVAEAAQATATLHDDDEGSGDIAISSWADVVSGSSISVYKTHVPIFSQEVGGTLTLPILADRHENAPTGS